MSGRQIYDRYEKIIGVVSKLYCALPLFVSDFIASFFSYKSGFLAVFIRYMDARKKFRFVGGMIYLAPMIVLKNQNFLSVGRNLSLHEYCYIDAAGGIVIGDNVSIAHGCSLISFEHTWSDREIPIKYNPTRLMPIIIEDDVWLGCGVRVLSGSIIRSRVVVAAGSIVKGELESGFLYAGVPAKKIKAL